VHIFNEVILITDRFFRMLTFTGNPLREENCAVNQGAIQIKQQADAGAGGLMPVYFVDARGELNRMHFLVGHPAATYQSLMNAVVAGGFVASVPLIFPAIIVGIDKMRTDEL
jgi:hypothetical protein